MIILHVYYAETNSNHHSWIIQYSIFHKNFQRITGRKNNHSFIGSAKIHEYTADSCPTYGEFIIEAADQEPFVLDKITLFCKNS